MVPGQPRELFAVKADGGRGVEVVTFDENAAAVGEAAAIGIERDKRVRGVLIRGSMVLANADKAVSRAIEREIRVAEIDAGCDWLRLRSRSNAVDALIGEVREVGGAVNHR